MNGVGGGGHVLTRTVKRKDKPTDEDLNHEAARKNRLLSEEDREDIKEKLQTIVNYVSEDSANIEGLLQMVVRVYSSAYGRGFIAGRRYDDKDFGFIER